MEACVMFEMKSWVLKHHPNHNQMFRSITLRLI